MIQETDVDTNWTHWERRYWYICRRIEFLLYRTLCRKFTYLRQRTLLPAHNFYWTVTEGTIICAALWLSKIEDTHDCAEHYGSLNRTPRSAQYIHCSVIENTKVCAEQNHSVMEKIKVCAEHNRSVIENTKFCAEHISFRHREHQGLCRTFVFL